MQIYAFLLVADGKGIVFMRIPFNAYIMWRAQTSSLERELHCQHIVGHMAACGKEGIACLKASARCIEREGMGVGLSLIHI